MRVLYHVTSRDNLPSILENGLLTNPAVRSGTVLNDKKLLRHHGCIPIFLAEEGADMLGVMWETYDDPVMLRVELDERVKLHTDLTTLSFYGGWYDDIAPKHDENGDMIYELPEPDAELNPYIYASWKDGDMAFSQAFSGAFGPNACVLVSEFMDSKSKAYAFAADFTKCFVVEEVIPPKNIKEVSFDHSASELVLQGAIKMLKARNQFLMSSVMAWNNFKDVLIGAMKKVLPDRLYQAVKTETQKGLDRGETPLERPDEPKAPRSSSAGGYEP